MTVLQYLKQDDPKVSPWQKTCSLQQCTDDGVQLTVRPRSGKAVLRRGRLEVIYFPPYFRKTHTKKRPMIKTWGYLSVQCGYKNFRSNENHPAVLCGKLGGTFAFLSDVYLGRGWGWVVQGGDLFDFECSKINMWLLPRKCLSSHATIKKQKQKKPEDLS